MWQEIWNTVLSEFSDVPDAEQVTRITLRLLVAATLEAYWDTSGSSKARVRGCEHT
jgi:putative Mg2+ transporter-C (MgtC) family protein